MSDEKNVHDENEVNKSDLRNPADREALKRDADEFLKTRKKEASAEAADDDAENGESDPMDSLKKENADLRNQMLLMAADMENLRKRTTRDVADAKAYSVANFARDMLSVSDNLSRALEAIPEGEREQDKGLNGLAEGVEMTERAMMAALERHGVKKIEPDGQRFDPNFHQAMFEVADPELENNIVKQVVQSGYVIGERVLRPAMVGVTKNNAKQEPVAEDKKGE